jgi:hypothetical protein
MRRCGSGSFLRDEENTVVMEIYGRQKVDNLVDDWSNPASARLNEKWDDGNHDC